VACYHVASVTPSTRASGEMADALASGASVRKDVGVQVPPRAPTDVYRSLLHRSTRLGSLASTITIILRSEIFSRPKLSRSCITRYDTLPLTGFEWTHVEVNVFINYRIPAVQAI